MVVAPTETEKASHPERCRRGRARWWPIVGGLAAWLAAGPVGAAGDDASYETARNGMIETIERYARESEREVGATSLAPRVIDALRRVPRHQFVEPSLRPLAYADRPLPIGHGQTISQPFIVALMTDLLRPEPDDVVLEIGTGSGYQAAVLSGLVKAVKSIEVIPDLAGRARERLTRLGYANVETRTGDGFDGWPDAAPFDGIVVTAAATQIPPPLVAQLERGGRMVIPVGGAFSLQFLVLVEKDKEGNVTTRQLMPVAFVPFKRGP